MRCGNYVCCDSHIIFKECDRIILIYLNASNCRCSQKYYIRPISIEPFSHTILFAQIEFVPIS